MTLSYEEKKNSLKNLEFKKGVAYLVEKGSRILGNPILMIDTSYNMICCTKNVVCDDWIWNEIIANGKFTHDTVEFFRQEGFIECYAQSYIVSEMKSDKLKYDRMNGKLFDKDDVQLGDLIILACRQNFSDGDIELFEMLCEIISVELQNSVQYNKIDRVYKQTALNNILDGENIDEQKLQNEIDGFAQIIKSKLYIGVIDITQYEETVTHLSYFRDLFKELYPEFLYYIHSNYIVAVISFESEVVNFEIELQKFLEFFNKYNVYMGLSGCFDNLYNAKKYYKEAINALNYGLKSKKAQKIFFFDNYRIEYFLNSLRDTYNIENLFNNVVNQIKIYDNNNKTYFLEILYEYILYGMNINVASAACKMEVEKFSATLLQISKIFNINLTDGDLLLNIFLAIKILFNTEM